MTFKPNQDVIFQEVKLFIEGVQVPYISIQVNSGIGTLPSANIALPPYPGLMDICRYYQPKVHIFFVDPNDGEEKVLFNGHINGNSYTRSRQGGSVYISFTCSHKNALLSNVLVDFTNPIGDTLVGDANSQAQDGGQRMNAFNSQHAVTVALRGILEKVEGKVAIEKANEEAIKASFQASSSNNNTDPALLGSRWANKDYYNRFKGIPGVLMNLWNQLKLNSVTAPKDFESMVMYTQVVEEGIQFFDRLAGHFLVEDAIDKGKMDPCRDKGKGKDQLIVPSCLRLFVQSAVQTDTAIMVLSQSMNFSGEMTDFLSIYNRLLDRIDYDLVTLTSPAETRLDPEEEWSTTNTQAVETIVKPQTPFYYSPNCNIYYPSMYSSLSVTQDESAVPTRITLTAQQVPYSGSNLHKKYRTPASVREAIAAAYAETDPSRKVTKEEEKKAFEAGNLLSTTDGLKNKNRVGVYEWGRGVKSRRYEMPYWLTVYGQSVKGEDSKEIFSESQEEKDALELLQTAWNYRYGYNKRHLNPYDPSSGVWPHERLLFASADYQFTKEVAASRAGNLEGIFNPYIIPGYPMDILDNSPVNPCFHAMCSSVTHTITSNSISTSVSFVAAITYSELANYYLQFINPWLQVKLKIVAKRTTQNGKEEYISSIVNNEEGRKVAEEEFYIPTLGVGSLAPDEMYDFEKGTLRPISVETEVKSGEAREINPMLTSQGNLLLVSRPIESRKDVETRFGLTFIDMTENNYNQNVIKYSDAELAVSKLLEPGQSQFLEYPRQSEEISPDP